MAPPTDTFSHSSEQRGVDHSDFTGKIESREEVPLREAAVVNKSEEKKAHEQLQQLDEDEESEYQLIPLSEIKPAHKKQQHDQEREPDWRHTQQRNQGGHRDKGQKRKHQPSAGRRNQRPAREDRYYGAIGQQELPDLDESSIAPVSSRQANEEEIGTHQNERNNSPGLREQATLLTTKLSEERKEAEQQPNDDLESFILERSLMI